MRSLIALAATTLVLLAIADAASAANKPGFAHPNPRSWGIVEPSPRGFGRVVPNPRFWIVEPNSVRWIFRPSPPRF